MLDLFPYILHESERLKKLDFEKVNILQERYGVFKIYFCIHTYTTFGRCGRIQHGKMQSMNGGKIFECFICRKEHIFCKYVKGHIVFFYNYSPLLQFYP